ncbi:hypothetical protein [Mycobacterium sp. E3305]|uniref:hypothetical protein n=1 Tax=Mycobacterium sp. E3305 TaxID=1834145 RepID=UPI0007FDFACA|nr:hypothetical protein [Mycobacterium sp. E3305]OBG70284.1 hypothetical protein A5701_03595 [Mycobacterium sp. E3305]
MKTTRVAAAHAELLTEGLRFEIYDVCRDIDHRLGNRLGTAEKGCYFWLWDDDTRGRHITSIEVLAALRRDAVAYLAALPAAA